VYGSWSDADKKKTAPKRGSRSACGLGRGFWEQYTSQPRPLPSLATDPPRQSGPAENDNVDRVNAGYFFFFAFLVFFLATFFLAFFLAAIGMRANSFVVSSGSDDSHHPPKREQYEWVAISNAILAGVA
jgi:hypothetical protein